MPGKTLLFHNGDYHIQKPLTVKEINSMTFADYTDVFYSRHGRNNTGIFLMTDTFAKLLDAEWIRAWHDFSGTTAKAVVTNMFHFISTQFIVDVPYWQRMLDSGVKIIPLSLGINTTEGQKLINGDLKRILEQMSERAELACRNEFSAETLAANGIKNVRVVGCPSMFYGMNRGFVVNNNKKNSVNSINVSFNTCDPAAPRLPRYIKELLPLIHYFQDIHFKKGVHNNRNINVAYSVQEPLSREYFSRLWTASSPDEFSKFYNDCGRFFFSVDDWIAGVREFDFSFGTRWHGNVAAILAGCPALVIIQRKEDVRARGFCEYHKVPYIEINDFDPGKPIEYYYELADYTEFNKNYAKTYDTFLDYCQKNDVELKIDSEAANE